MAVFFEANLRHIKGPLIGQPFRLDAWQREDLGVILEHDGKGRPLWREVLWGVPRGMGKSPTAAGLGLAELARRQDVPEVYIGSGARDQAAIVGEYAREMAANGTLQHWTRPIIGGVRWDRRGGGVIRTVSADGGLQHGKSPAKVILDELHVFTTAKQEELYNAMASSLHKRPDSQLIGITTAGWSRQTLLGELYDAMLKAPVVERSGPLGCRLVCKDKDAGRLMIWWGAPDDADAADHGVWKACNPASWIAPAEIARLARTLPRAVFERLHLNRWTESSEQVIRAEAWDACRAELSEPDSVVLGWSAGPRRDQAALVAVWPVGDVFHARLVASWSDVDQGTIEAELGNEVEAFARSHRVDVFAADPIQLPDVYERVSGLGLGEYRGAKAQRAGMPQTDAFMEPATSALASMIERCQLRVSADDRELRAQTLRCEAMPTRRGWRLGRPKRVGERKPESVEAGHALAMAVYAAESESSRPRPFVEAWG